MLNNTMSPSPGPKKKDEKRKKLVTAYILFSMDQRRITMEENPGVRFGEISRTIAEKWKQLSDQEKKVIIFLIVYNKCNNPDILPRIKKSTVL